MVNMQNAVLMDDPCLQVITTANAILTYYLILSCGKREEKRQKTNLLELR